MNGFTFYLTYMLGRFIVLAGPASHRCLEFSDKAKEQNKKQKFEKKLKRYPLGWMDIGAL